MIRVKFCGITRKVDALTASRLGVHALGFIFAKESARYIAPDLASRIIAELPPFVLKVGVFINEEEENINNIISLCKLEIIQLHGDESAKFCNKFHGKTRVIKSISVKKDSVLRMVEKYNSVDAILLDTHDDKLKGGTGKSFDWEIAKEAKSFGKPIILSGGLNPQNIKEAIADVNPYAVDVSSGIEKSPGIKDHELMAKFLASAWEEEWGC